VARTPTFGRGVLGRLLARTIRSPPSQGAEKKKGKKKKRKKERKIEKKKRKGAHGTPGVTHR
jgi:hypothetical protein